MIIWLQQSEISENVDGEAIEEASVMLAKLEALYVSMSNNFRESYKVNETSSCSRVKAGIDMNLAAEHDDSLAKSRRKLPHWGSERKKCRLDQSLF